MNLYLITRQKLGCGYDEAKGFVIAAASIKEARGIAAEHAGMEGARFWWRNKTSVVCCIGRAENMRVGIILRSFNWG